MQTNRTAFAPAQFPTLGRTDGENMNVGKAKRNETHSCYIALCIMSWNMLLIKRALGALYLWGLGKMTEQFVCMKAGFSRENVFLIPQHNLWACLGRVCVSQRIYSICVCACACACACVCSWSFLPKFASINFQPSCSLFSDFHIYSKNVYFFPILFVATSRLNASLLTPYDFLSLFWTLYKLHD